VPRLPNVDQGVKRRGEQGDPVEAGRRRTSDRCAATLDVHHLPAAQKFLRSQE
jgi:hypothetical protein